MLALFIITSAFYIIIKFIEWSLIDKALAYNVILFVPYLQV